MTDIPSTHGGEVRQFPARLGILPETAAFVEAFCMARGIGRDDTLRLALIVEELVTNSVMHGYREESDAPIFITLAAGAGGVVLLYEDAAPAYDPTAAFSHSHDPLDEEVSMRVVGRLGLRLVGQLAARTRYAHDGERNRLWLQVEVAGEV